MFVLVNNFDNVNSTFGFNEYVFTRSDGSQQSFSIRVNERGNEVFYISLSMNSCFHFTESYIDRGSEFFSVIEKLIS
jgi:hypothetical protein